uniref:Proteasome endopeptidase complex n=1 Tax=Anguilla anguilla TaxID=7936 RepID=A0A0E9TDD9_ANGAN
MTSPYVLETQHGGFNFENCCRNSQLQASSAQDIKLKAKKTGTTIAGVVFKDGVVLGADTRATVGGSGLR